jgi:hypothetical protein
MTNLNVNGNLNVNENLNVLNGEINIKKLAINGDYGSNTKYLKSGGSDSDLTWDTIASSPWTTSNNDIYYNSGNVGIKTTSPAYPLEVNGEIKCSSSLTLTGVLRSNSWAGPWGGYYGWDLPFASGYNPEPIGIWYRTWQQLSTTSGHKQYIRHYIENIHSTDLNNLEHRIGWEGADNGTAPNDYFDDAPGSFPQQAYIVIKPRSGPSAGQLSFTGQHRNVPNNIDLYNNINNYVGYIVCSIGNYKTYNYEKKILEEKKNAITINDALPVIELSNKKQQKTVFGVISDKEEEDRKLSVGAFCTPYSNINDHKRLYINSIGEGAIWIVNTNGNLENGDYIQSSDVIGMGEKQDSEFLANYTVAKITCDCNFELNTDNYECIEFVDPTSGNTYKKAFVGCSYHCG